MGSNILYSYNFYFLLTSFDFLYLFILWMSELLNLWGKLENFMALPALLSSLKYHLTMPTHHPTSDLKLFSLFPRQSFRLLESKMWCLQKIFEGDSRSAFKWCNLQHIGFISLTITEPVTSNLCFQIRFFTP